MLREAVHLLQPMLGGGALLEGSFRLVCASLVPLGGFRNMGRTEWPVFACRPDLRQHMQQLQLRCLELRTRRPSTQGPAARSISWLRTCCADQDGGPRRARTSSCACSARGQWQWPGHTLPQRLQTSGRTRAACALAN